MLAGECDVNEGLGRDTPMRAGRVRRVLRNAFLSDGFLRFGLPFARDYLRIAWRSAGRWDASAGMMRVLDRRIAYPNHSAALFLLHEIFVNGAYAFDAPGRQPRIIDCGANIGMSVLFFKTLHPEAHVIAFEPDPQSFAHLVRNVRDNRLSDVRLVNSAVAERHGVLTLYTDEGDGGSLVASINPRLGGAIPQPVRAVRLSSFIDGPVDFLKIDVEGAEYGIVRELLESGTIARVREAAIEFHAGETEGDGVTRLIEQLRSSGMKVTMVVADPTRNTGLLRARRESVPTAARALAIPGETRS
jgi:FkbM family methyltransferase